MSQVPLRLLGKQNIQAKEVYYAEMDIDLINHNLVVPQGRVGEDLAGLTWFFSTFFHVL